MVKSKRSKVIPLSKTKKSSGVDKKDKLHFKIQKCVDSYDYVYAFRYKNMTSLPFQELKKYWESSLYITNIIYLDSSSARIK